MNRTLSCVLLSLALWLQACGDSAAPATDGPVTPPPPAPLGRDLALADWPALPAANSIPVGPEVLAARSALLGIDALDPTRVELWWYGVSSFVANLGGHLVLLDAWEPIGIQDGYGPLTRDQLVELKPEAIFIGHGHFDHAGDAGYVAGRTGAVVIGSQEICDEARADAAVDGLERNFDCLITGTADTPAPGTLQLTQFWSDLPEVAVLQHIHSAPTLEPQNPGLPFVHIPNLLPYLLNPNTSPEELQRFLLSLDDEQGGTWLYHFRVGDFSLLWNDSTGPIGPGNPGGAEVQAALQSLPGCVDVQATSIVGFNQPLSGLRDPRYYVEFAKPKVVLPTHHDAWAPVVGGGAAAYRAEWERELATLDPVPESDYLSDPDDYLVVRRYNIADPRWRDDEGCATP